MQQTLKAKDLTREAPRSPNIVLGGYVILGRTLDKCRALLAGTIGDYHFDCPLDNMLFGWKRISGNDFKAALAEGKSDEEMVQWLDNHGRSKSEADKEQWREEVRKATLYNDPEKREFFVTETRKLGLNPETTTLFEWLEADDRASYPQAAA
jgi:hypothetical protein